MKANTLARERTGRYTSLGQLEDKILGPKGTPKRDRYELELKAELLGEAIRDLRKQLDLTQEELGEKIGVQKAQISKLEKSGKNVTVDTLIKVFNALNAKVKLQIETSNQEISIA